MGSSLIRDAFQWTRLSTTRDPSAGRWPTTQGSSRLWQGQTGSIHVSASLTIMIALTSMRADAALRAYELGSLRRASVAPNSMPEVDAAVREAFMGLSLKASDISIPLHVDGPAIWLPVILEGTLAGMLGNGAPPGIGGSHLVDLYRRLAVWKTRGNELSDVLRVLLVAGQVVTRRQGNLGYAMAQNLARRLREAYDTGLRDVDLLAMPTLCRTAAALPAADASLAERFARAVETVTNTAQFNLTGHPALTIPCGKADGLPIGLMLVGRRFEEGKLYSVAAAIEAHLGGPPPLVIPSA